MQGMHDRMKEATPAIFAARCTAALIAAHKKRPSETAIAASKGRYVSYSVTTGMPRLLNGSGSICTGRFTSNSGLYCMPTSEYFAPAVL